MSAAEHKDIRSASKEFKRQNDHKEKWAHGVCVANTRASYSPDEPVEGYLGIKLDKDSNGKWIPNARSAFQGETTVELPKQKHLPNGVMKWDGFKSHANKTPKPNGSFRQVVNSPKIDARQAKKVDAVTDAKDITSAMSKSLADLLPTHANNTQSAIQIALRESTSAADADILYSFDNKGPSPSSQGRNVDLGGLVDIAEKKWANEQTEKIVKGEYEVLDHEGEVVRMKKGKKSPKQKAVKITSVVSSKAADVEEDDGFELI